MLTYGLILSAGRVIGTPLSAAQALRSGTMAELESRTLLESWGLPEPRIELPIESLGWA